MNSSIESAALPNKAHQVAQIDRNGVVSVGIFVRGDRDCVAAFSFQPGNKLARSHGDKRVINESVNGALRQLPIAPGSVAVETSKGVLVDRGRDGRLYPLEGSDAYPGDPAVATINYFTGELRWMRGHQPTISSDVDPDTLEGDELEAYLMGDLELKPVVDVKASYLQTKLIKAHTKQTRAVSVSSNNLLRVYVAANGGDSRVRIDL
jgi:hypothetical protein